MTDNLSWYPITRKPYPYDGTGYMLAKKYLQSPEIDEWECVEGDQPHLIVAYANELRFPDAYR